MRILFVVQEGALLQIPPEKKVESITDVQFMPGVIQQLVQISNDEDTIIVLINRTGTKDTAQSSTNINQLVENLLQTEGLHFAGRLTDLQISNDASGSIQELEISVPPVAAQYLIGTTEKEAALGRKLQAVSCALGYPLTSSSFDHTFTNWTQVQQFLQKPRRIATVHRKTHETDIELTIDLDGQGKSQIQSGLGFLDHMLELFARHSACDIKAKIGGDLQVDEHHTVEDTAIVLGQAIDKALGDKRGVERYGFVLPMDESLAHVALDLSGRNTLVWSAEFKRERIGDMPTELFSHFFKSLVDNARCNLHIKVEGQNEHHKIEAIFKAFAHAFKQAIRYSETDRHPLSTKGVL
ncbi:MAG: imidazoleglycerol-phosphate dehydratase HisB [Caldithrix sp.]|nr:imidazoleglycerol-phosphate dehydratase HisB [Caldithrix sp.]